MDGKAVIISAPSGAGKTTIVKHLLKIKELNLEFSVSACTRPMREGEVNGQDYYFLSVDQFKDKIDEDEFIEWEEVYKNNYYGTLRTEVSRIWSLNHHVLFDVDVMGGINLKEKFGDQALAVFIKPPSIEILRSRLESRGTESQEKIRNRMNKATLELKFVRKFDVIVLNDNLETALAEAQKLVAGFLKKFHLNMKVGLFFGSFNPVHIGHLAVANYMAEFTDLQQVWFVISPQNPLKKSSTLLEDHKRRTLIEIAIENEDRFRVCDIEFRLPKPSYTIETLINLKELYPLHEFVLIMGSDGLSNFNKWKNHTIIEKNYQRYIYPRPGYEINADDNAGILKVDAPRMEISSTFIRHALRSKHNIRHFLPHKVYDYITEMHFYEK